MRIIGLDESGKFEDRKALDIRFVGGYVFDDIEADNIGAVRRELSSEFEAVCSNFTRECHKKFISDKEMLNIASDLKVSLKAVEPSLAFIYPLSLHLGNNQTIFKFSLHNVQNKKSNGANDKPYYLPVAVGSDETLKAWCLVFKEKLRRLSLSYIQSKGGRFFCLLYPSPTVSPDTGMYNSNILQFHSGANLYEYMTQMAFLNQLMYGFDKPDSSYSLEFATRKLKGALMDTYENYQPDANSSRKLDEREWYYQITVPSTYKSILAMTLSDPDFYNSEYKDAKYHLDVVSIKYHAGGEAMQRIPDSKEWTPLHYLADIACGVILKEIRNVVNTQTLEIDSSQLGKISQIKLSDSSWVSLELRMLDECEYILRKMIKAIHKIDLVQYYESIYELKNLKQQKQALNTKQFYIDYWLKRADAFLAERMKKKDYFDAVVNRFPEYCKVLRRYMTVDVKYAIGLYAAENLIKLARDLDEKIKSSLGNIMFTLYDICLRGYNHEGANERVAQIIAMAEYYAQSVSMDEYIDYSTRCLQYYFNRLDFNAALIKASNLEALAKPYFAACQQLCAKSKEIIEDIVFPSNGINSRSSGLIAKIYSNIGQACAYLTMEGNRQENSEPKIGELSAAKAFKMALDIYDNLNDCENYSISLSHYLHFLCHIRDKSEYEEYAPQYLGSSDLTGQFQRIRQIENKFAARFCLRVYVKSILVFYTYRIDTPETDAGLLEDIISYVEENYADEHPWQLICANLYEILWRNAKIRGQTLDAKYDIFYQRATLRTKQHEDQDTIDIIKLRFKVYMALLNDPSVAGNDASVFLEPSDFFVVEKFNLKEYDKSRSLSLSDLYTILNKYVCYEYC